MAAGAATRCNFAIGFRDGDGDLGLSDEDIGKAPYNTTTGGPNNRGYSYNYFIQPYMRTAVPGIRRSCKSDPPPFRLSGRIRRPLPPPRRQPTAASPAAPLGHAALQASPVRSTAAVFRAGQVLRFEISIMDRDLHQSNVITTPARSRWGSSHLTTGTARLSCGARAQVICRFKLH